MIWNERLKSAKVKGVQSRSFSELYRTLSQYADQADHHDPITGKDLILQTRCAIRFATLCMADEEVRHVVQGEAVLEYGLHRPLCRILMSSDGNCRLLAARLLSNLVTNNPETAACVMEHAALSPSHDEVSAQIKSIAIDEGTVSSMDTKNCINWTDIFLKCRGQREALAAVVAALHNCYVMLENRGGNGRSQNRQSMADNQILMSTLLRHMLPPAVDTNEDSRADAATEWITLLLEALCQRGLFVRIYKGIGLTVTPEHLVLLHCVAAAVDEWFQSSHSSWDDHPLGTTSTLLVESHEFLAHEASRIREFITQSHEMDLILSKSARLTIFEILATSLGNDSNDHLAVVRTKLSVCLLPQVAQDLTLKVDALLVSNEVTNTRELHIADEDQRWITTLVQLLGNVCYRCKTNQDALRNISVVGTGSSVTATRSALHVLLSCTSLSHGCFTLREWAIVALRNVLEGNAENQAIVEQLEAQQPLQSVELESMGLQVDMDRNGKVRVIPKQSDELNDVKSLLE